MKPFRSQARILLHRWLPLLYLLPAIALLRPVFWNILDNRFYNYFQSKRAAPAWDDVVVVGIDRATQREVFDRPILPLSGHAREHAQIADLLAKAGARAIAFDLELSRNDFKCSPTELAEAFRSAGNVFLAVSLGEKRDIAGIGGARILRARHFPDSILVEASQGAFVVDVSVDPDGVIRRFRSDERLARMDIESLPEKLAGFKITDPIPIEYPSIEHPIPTISYRDVLAADITALAMVDGRVAFVGDVGSSAIDLVAVPQLQDLGDGTYAYGLPGVVVLAAATQTLLRGAPLRDASNGAMAAWIVLWALISVTALPRRRPALAVLVLSGIILLALAATGLIHVWGDLIFPAGLLLGTLVICGIYTLISSHIRTLSELHIEELENEKTRREMELARQTQERFLPRSIPQIKGLDIWGVNLSSAAVSGDYYDVIDVNDSGPLVISIADVSGKGIPASLIMSNVQAVLHSHTLHSKFDLQATASDLNGIISANTDVGTFVTMFLGEIDKHSHLLRYVRAGHDLPLLVSSDGSVRWLKEGGMFFGFLPEASYEILELKLEQGDVFCLYTDGVTEARSRQDEEFGPERLAQVVTSSTDLDAKGICDAILRSVEEFTARSGRADDMTLLIVRVS